MKLRTEPNLGEINQATFTYFMYLFVWRRMNCTARLVSAVAEDAPPDNTLESVVV